MRKEVRSEPAWAGRIVWCGVIAAAIAGLVGWMYSLGVGPGWPAAWPIAAAVFASLWVLFATSDLSKNSWRYRLGQNAYWLLVPGVLLAQTVGLLDHSVTDRHNSRVVLLWMVAILVGRNRQVVKRTWHRFDPFAPLVFRLIPDPPPNHTDPPPENGSGLVT